MLINIHTHHKPLPNEYVIRNAYLPNLSILKGINYNISAGIHPWYISANPAIQLKQLENLLGYKQVIAIGECGLDRIKGPDLEIQKQVLFNQIDLANQYNKPLIIHLVKSYSDILAFAEKFKTTWIVHGFRGNLFEANNIIIHGGHLSFGRELLRNKNLQSVFKTIPINRIYFESDTIAMSIKSIYSLASELKSISTTGLIEQIEANFTREFNTTIN